MIITFFGHSRLLSEDMLDQRVEGVILESIAHEKTISFYCGGYGDFDELCARVCRKIQRERPDCEIVYVAPYITEAEQKKMEYLKAMSYYDATVYPSIEGVPIRLAIIKRNEWMAEQADLVIAYVKHSYGGAFRALMHARRKKKHIVNLAEQDQDK